jgi:hypothetical protein
MSFEWSANLLVHVTAPTAGLLQVELSFTISCGNDTMLLILQREGARWEEAMRWQAAPYSEVSGAFGDGFFTAILTPQAGQWHLAVIHGHPWCTSRFSGFSIDILAPTSDSNRPRVIWHTDRGYSRGDYLERLKVLGPDTFEFRNNADAMEFGPEGIAFERTVVYRYRLTGNKVTRLEPIATNGRGFVEEWLTMPWDEAAAQSAPEALASLRPLHLLHERSNDGNLNSYTSWSAGPVRACSATGRFQVAFDSQRENLESTKPSGDHGPVLHYYFLIQQVSGGYRMESVADSPGSSCVGPDLMRRSN